MRKIDVKMASKFPTLLASALITSFCLSHTALAMDGKAVYEKTCKTCHATGVMGAPKLGDKKDWGERVAKGKDSLAQNAIKGYKGKKGMMPPKGGNPKLTDDEIKAAIDYMLDSAK